MAIGVAITTRNRLILEARTDILDDPYIQVQDLWELEKRVGAKKRRTQIVNVYDNHLCADQVGEEVESTSPRRACADAKWGSLMEGSVILLGDFKAHNPE